MANSKVAKTGGAAAKQNSESRDTWDEGQRLWEAQSRLKLPKKWDTDDGKLNITAESAAHATLDASLGSNEGDFQGYCMTQLANIMSEAASDLTMPMNAAIAMLHAIGPRDELEAMLAMQMVATNALVLKTARLSVHADNPLNRQMNGNLNTKFARTFTAQLEALNRHRRGGKQVVEHVHVNAGGQAVIAGTISTRKGGGGE